MDEYTEDQPTLEENGDGSWTAPQEHPMMEMENFNASDDFGASGDGMEETTVVTTTTTKSSRTKKSRKKTRKPAAEAAEDEEDVL